MKVKRKKTGIESLDKMLGGGIPEQSVIQVKGAPGCGKTTFSRNFLAEGILNKEKCIYVFTGEPINRIKESLQQMIGCDNPEECVQKYEENVIFIDCYSWRVPGSKPIPGIKKINSLTELNELNRMIKDSMDELKMSETGGRIVLDSISDMLLYDESKSVFRFMQLFVGLARSGPNVGLVILEEGLHEKKDVATLNYITDGLIEMKTEVEKRFLRVARMTQTTHDLKWMKFQLTAHGLRSKLEGFFN